MYMCISTTISTTTSLNSSLVCPNQNAIVDLNSKTALGSLMMLVASMISMSLRKAIMKFIKELQPKCKHKGDHATFS